MRSLEELSATPKCATLTEYKEYSVLVPKGKSFDLAGTKFPDLGYATDRCLEEGGTILNKDGDIHSIFVKI